MNPFVQGIIFELKKQGQGAPNHLIVTTSRITDIEPLRYVAERTQKLKSALKPGGSKVESPA